MKAIWNVGKGYETDPETKVLLEHISGWGKDTFDDILFNMEVTKRVGGDAFCEIIRDPETDIIVNLKPLDPSTIRIVVDSKGVIKRYEQTSKVKGKIIKFKPEEILHLSNNRLADQIHGISDIESLQATIDAENTTFTDTNQIMHKQARPLIMFKLGTDDQAKINSFIAKMDEAVAKGENIYIPDDENAVSYEVVQVNPSQMVLAWRDDIRNKFYRSIGLPQIVPGASGGGTESESKVIYMAFENIVQRDQKGIEQQLKAQLNIEIDLIPPTSLLQDLQNDTAKDGTSAFQPQDVNAGANI
jgi:phage portal protein BeeE